MNKSNRFFSIFLLSLSVMACTSLSTRDNYGYYDDGYYPYYPGYYYPGYHNGYPRAGIDYGYRQNYGYGQNRPSYYPRSNQGGAYAPRPSAGGGGAAAPRSQSGRGSAAPRSAPPPNLLPRNSVVPGESRGNSALPHGR